MTDRNPALPPSGAAAPRRKKPDLVADQIKWLIADRQIAEGERLPQEPELARKFNVSKGTIRETLKSLEVQGIVRIKTGPGGGATVTRVRPDTAIELLGNFFYARAITITDIYAVRKELEPQLAEAVVGKLGPSHIEALEGSVGFCSCDPLGPETRHRQRLSELDFHDILADACDNQILAFNCRFLNSLLRNLAVCRAVYARETEDLAARARIYHSKLVSAYRAEDRRKVRRLMYDHMVEAEQLMTQHAAVVENRFIMREDLTWTG